MLYTMKLKKIKQVTKLQGELLREEKIGHHDWYAEMLVCSALEGQLAMTNQPNYDILCSAPYNKVQVKSRVDGTDGIQNRTNFKRYKPDAFNYAAIVIFRANYKIKGAILLPLKDAHSLMKKAGHVKWGDALNHKNAICIKDKLLEVSGE